MTNQLVQIELDKRQAERERRRQLLADAKELSKVLEKKSLVRVVKKPTMTNFKRVQWVRFKDTPLLSAHLIYLLAPQYLMP